MIPEPIQKFIEAFSRLPSFGPRLTTRLAFYITGLDRSSQQSLEEALGRLKTLNRCTRCFFLKEESRDLCSICTSSSRNPRLIAVVEKETDLLALENTGKFNGQYLLLGELPERGVLQSMQKLRLQHLKQRIKKELEGSLDELVIAVNLNTFGDFIAGLIRQEFQGMVKKITRLGRGIPTGGEIEFADEETLGSALERRT